MAYKMTDADQQPVFLFGKVYNWFVNKRGKLELEKFVASAEDEALYGAEVDELIAKVKKESKK